MERNEVVEVQDRRGVEGCHGGEVDGCDSAIGEDGGKRAGGQPGGGSVETCEENERVKEEAHGAAILTRDGVGTYEAQS